MHINARVHIIGHTALVNFYIGPVKHKDDTKLSKQFWEVKMHDGTPNITCKIVRICRSYNPNSKRCLLCLHEKYEIATCKGGNLLSRRTETTNTCRRRSKYKLANCDTID